MAQKEFRISHPCGFEISSKLVESNMAAIEGVEKRDMHTGWVWYDLPHGELFGKNVSFSLGFLNGDLNTIIIALIDPVLYGSGSSDWDEKKEQLRAQHTGEWLEASGYKLGSYSWGEVWAGYDSKGGFGRGWVRYNR